MNERVVVAQANNLQVASLAQPRIVKITKPRKRLGAYDGVVVRSEIQSFVADITTTARSGSISRRSRRKV